MNSLGTFTARAVVKVLTQFISVFGIPKVLQGDQGSDFSSQLFDHVLKQLGVKHNKASVHHAQCLRAVERFHQTLKSLLCGYCTTFGQDWEEGLPWLLLAASDVVHESTGFSPNEHVFGHPVRSPLLQDIVTHTEPPEKLVDNISGFQHCLYVAGEMAKEYLGAAQKKTKCLYDCKVEVHRSSPGDQGLALLPV